MDDQQSPQSNKVYLYILLVVVVVFVLIALTIAGQKKPVPQMQSGTVTPTSGQMTRPAKGSFTLASPTGSVPRVAQGSQVQLQLKGTSEGENIVGYDALVSYDPEVLEFVSATSLDSSFKIVATPSEGFISVTGSKSPSVTKSTVFDASDLVTFTFKSKKAGQATVSIVSSRGKESTKIVNEATSIFTPAVSSIVVTVY